MAHIEITAPDNRRWNEELREQEPLTIGRHSTNTIAIDDDLVPTLLARVLWNKKSSGYEITAATEQDLQISGKAVRTTTLAEGDELLIAGYQLVYHETQTARPSPPPAPETPPKQSEEAEDDPDEIVDLDEPREKSRRKKRKRKSSKDKSGRKVRLSKSASEEDESLGEWLTRKRRPGERDALRSPLVTSLAFLGLILLVAVAAVYLLIGRDAANAQLQAARADREAGKFGQAASRYEQFLDEFAYSKNANAARRELAFTKIDLALTGIASDLQVAIQEVEQFVDQFRQDEDFRDTYPELALYSSRIALDAYAEASRRHDPAFLTVGDEARSLFNRFYTGEPNDPRIVELEQAASSARADLLEFDVRREALQLMDARLKEEQVSATLETFRGATARYPNFADDSEFVTRVQQALELERQQITASVTSTNQSSQETTPPPSNPSVGQEAVLVHRKQARFDLQSDGQTVWLEAEGQVFGIDRQTGQPRWRQIVGPNAPFPPFPITTVEQAWLLAAEGGKTLRLVERDSGNSLWEAHLPVATEFAPLVTGAQAYLVADKFLYSLDLETGRLLGQMQFPRPLSAPVAALDDRRLIAIGREDVFYELDRMRWTCEAVRYYGQSPGTIAVQPFFLNESLLVIESDRLTAGRLQVLDRNDDGWRVRISQSERLPGIAVGQPVYWGDRLFLETYGPRIAVWQLSDRPNQAPLERLTVAPLPYAADTRMHILPIEGDRLLIAGESLRELTLLTNTFEQSDLGVQLGRSTQPLQQAGTQVFLAGRNAADSGVTLLDFDYESQKSSWSLRLGTSPRLLAPGKSDNKSELRVWNAQGQLFSISASNPTSSNEHAASQNWVNSAESLFEQPSGSTATSPIYFVRSGDETDVIAHFGRDAKLLNEHGETVRPLKLGGTPTRAGRLLGTAFLWANNRGLHWTSLEPDSPPTEPWDIPLEENRQNDSVNWSDLQLVDQESALAILEGKRAVAVKRRQAPKLHLAEMASFPLPQPVIGAGAVHAGNYSVGLSDGSLITLDARTLLVREQLPIEGGISAGPWIVGNLLLLESADHSLRAFTATTLHQPQWTLPFTSSGVAKPPQQIAPDEAILSLNDGRQILFRPRTGQTIKQWELPAAAACPAVVSENSLWFGLQNGTVVRIDR